MLQNMVRTSMNFKEFNARTVLHILHFKDDGDMIFDIGDSQDGMEGSLRTVGSCHDLCQELQLSREETKRMIGEDDPIAV